jgi:hypothetical protein
MTKRRPLRATTVVLFLLVLAAIGYIVFFFFTRRTVLVPEPFTSDTYSDAPVNCFTQDTPLLNVSAEFIDKLNDERHIFGVITKQNEINGAVIVSLSNYAYRETTMNWIASLVMNGYSKFVVFCYDRDMAVYLAQQKWLGEYTVDFTEVADWWHKSYNLDKLVKSRVYFWCEMLRADVTFLFNDLDLVFLSRHVLEHLQFIYENSRADILFQQDQHVRAAAYNTGFFYATPTPFVKRLFNDLRGEIPKYTDQTGLQKMIERREEYRESSRI